MLPVHNAALNNDLTFFENIDLPCKIVNQTGGKYLSIPLQFALYNSNYKIILFLLLNGANADYKNIKRWDVFSIIYRYDLVLSFLLFESFNIKSTKHKKGRRILLLIYRYRNYNLIFINKYTLILNSLNIKNKRSPYFLYLNVIYSVELYTSDLRYLFIIYYILLVYLITYRHPKIQTNNLRETITHLILENNYNLENFCYICRDIKYRHCSYCDQCVIGQHHHCLFINNCVLWKNIRIFYFYIVLYAVILIYNLLHTEDIIKKIECGIIAIILVYNTL